MAVICLREKQTGSRNVTGLLSWSRDLCLRLVVNQEAVSRRLPGESTVD
jgi:hypothetical protein